VNVEVFQISVAVGRGTGRRCSAPMVRRRSDPRARYLAHEGPIRPRATPFV
jgi:hypothetical protein